MAIWHPTPIIQQKKGLVFSGKVFFFIICVGFPLRQSGQFWWLNEAEAKNKKSPVKNCIKMLRRYFTDTSWILHG